MNESVDPVIARLMGLAQQMAKAQYDGESSPEQYAKIEAAQQAFTDALSTALNRSGVAVVRLVEAYENAAVAYGRSNGEEGAELLLETRDAVLTALCALPPEETK